MDGAIVLSARNVEARGYSRRSWRGTSLWIFATLFAVVVGPMHCAAVAAEPIVITCAFESQPLMVLTYRDGMGGSHNTLQIGEAEPVELYEGSGLSSADVNGQDYTFSLAPPATVTIDNRAASAGSCLSSLPQLSNAAGRPTQSSAAVDVPAESGWTYSKTEDSMRGRTRAFAYLASKNVLDFEFPYGGGSRGTLTLRKTGEKTETLLSIDKGQFVCSPSTPMVSAKFDNGPIVEVRCVLPDDGEANIILLDGGAQFVGSLKRSHKLIVEATFFQAGPKQLDFDTAGLRW